MAFMLERKGSDGMKRDAVLAMVLGLVVGFLVGVFLSDRYVITKGHEHTFLVDNWTGTAWWAAKDAASLMTWEQMTIKPLRPWQRKQDTPAKRMH